MNGYWIEVFGVSLLLTCLIELVIAGLFGLHTKKTLILVILVNVLTNPPAVLVCRLGSSCFPELAVQLVTESLVVITEALIYRNFAKELPQIRRPFLLSLTANTVSWMIGVLFSIGRSL